MSFDLRLAVIALATFAVTSVAGALVVPWLTRTRAEMAPALRAQRLFHVRLLPTTLACLATLQGLASFVLFEPRNPREPVGLVLSSLAAGALALVAVALARLWLGARATRRVMRQWMATASPVSRCSPSSTISYIATPVRPVTSTSGPFTRTTRAGPALTVSIAPAPGLPVRPQPRRPAWEGCNRPRRRRTVPPRPRPAGP